MLKEGKRLLSWVYFLGYTISSNICKSHIDSDTSIYKTGLFTKDQFFRFGDLGLNHKFTNFILPLQTRYNLKILCKNGF